jgi:glycosyltransferase involved in cell wall biosynthesis
MVERCPRRKYQGKEKRLRLLFVADGRSPIALNWIRHWVERGDEVFLASTFDCATDLGLRGLAIVPVAFSGIGAAAAVEAIRPFRSNGFRTAVRQWLGPLTVARAARRLRTLIQRVQPDLVHALRIPYEGMVAGRLGMEAPLVVSIWGNDFTFHGRSTPLMRHETHRATRAADAMHADCARDIRLAREWGFSTDSPTLVTPSSGGIRTDIFHPPTRARSERVVINPRGIRGYVCNESFFRAAALVLTEMPDTRFLCAAMTGDAKVLQWIKKLGIGHAVELLPPRRHAEMADVYRRAQILVSPTVHDGTPNSLLEGMACGCFPVAGDLESVREWITPGVNGSLVNPRDPQALAKAILDALGDEEARRRASACNAEIIASRAEYGGCMARVEALYEAMVR